MEKKESDFGLQKSSELVWDSVSAPLCIQSRLRLRLEHRAKEHILKRKRAAGEAQALGSSRPGFESHMATR